MKWDKEIRGKFSVFVMSGNMDQCAAVKTALAQDGFDAFLFPDQETMISRLVEMKPHLIVFNKSALTTSLQKFVQIVVDQSSEIRFLPIAKPEDVQEYLNYREYNFSGCVLEGEALAKRVAWTADEIIKGIYLSYQNEQIFVEMENSKKELGHMSEQIDSEITRASNSAGLSLTHELAKYYSMDSKEEILKIFLSEINQKFLARNKKLICLYFKYLPTVQSFVIVQSVGIDMASIEGIGGKFIDEEAKDPIFFLKSGHIPREVTAIVKIGLKVSNYIFRPVFVQNNIDGFFVFWVENAPLMGEEIENELSLFMLLYEKGHLTKKLGSMEMADNVTELFNRHYYLKTITDEVSRARRLQKAVSVVKMRIDHLPEVEQVFGPGGKDQVLRTISGLVRKTSRTNDVSCRTADNEIALILPHAARKGASLRAERLRRLIETQTFQITGHRVTVSSGVSEYPSLCSSAEELERTANEALEFISDKGGNKVCLYKANDDFMPDYSVPPL